MHNSPNLTSPRFHIFFTCFLCNKDCQVFILTGFFHFFFLDGLVDEPDSDVVFYVLFRAVDKFYSCFDRYPGTWAKLCFSPTRPETSQNLCTLTSCDFLRQLSLEDYCYCLSYHMIIFIHMREKENIPDSYDEREPDFIVDAP